MELQPDIDIEVLQQELFTLRRERSAFMAQGELLEKLVSLARSPAQEEVLKITLQETLDIVSNLSGADKGSLFLLDSDGKVSESILTQKEQAAEIRAKLIGTVLDKGLAGWVLRHHSVGLIDDTEHDDRWFHFPGQSYIARSALAVPILRGDELIGILTLLHSEPGQFNSQIADLMQLTAAQIALVLENAALFGKLEQSYYSLDQAKQKIEAYSKALDAELDKGRKIQLNFLPSSVPSFNNWQIAACFHPARQVAGDFYDVFTLPGNKVGLVIADVCDKGVGAALFMALFRSLIRIFSGQAGLTELAKLRERFQDQLVLEIDSDLANDPEQVNALSAIPLVNNYVAEEHAEMVMFATIFFGVLNPETGILTYINGGHEPIFILNDQGVHTQLDHSGPAVGMMPLRKFKIRQAHLKVNDLLVGYTDGATDARSPDGKIYGSKLFQALLERLEVQSAEQFLLACQNELFDYIQDAQQFDDITMLAIRRTG